MTKEELQRLQEAQKLLGRLSKIEAQIESLEKCDLIQITGNEDYKRVALFDIPCDDKSNHPFKEQGKEFLESFKWHLRGKLSDLKEEFDKL